MRAATCVAVAAAAAAARAAQHSSDCTDTQYFVEDCGLISGTWNWLVGGECPGTCRDKLGVDGDCSGDGILGTGWFSFLTGDSKRCLSGYCLPIIGTGYRCAGASGHMPVGTSCLIDSDCENGLDCKTWDTTCEECEDVCNIGKDKPEDGGKRFIYPFDVSAFANIAYMDEGNAQSLVQEGLSGWSLDCPCFYRKGNRECPGGGGLWACRLEAASSGAQWTFAINQQTRTAVVAIAGTDSIVDWLFTNTRLDQWIGGFASTSWCDFRSFTVVHAGFKHMYQSFRTDVRAFVRARVHMMNKAIPPGEEPWKLVVTGHSLGGGLAQLAAMDLAHPTYDGDPCFKVAADVVNLVAGWALGVSDNSQLTNGSFEVVDAKGMEYLYNNASALLPDFSWIPIASDKACTTNSEGISPDYDDIHTDTLEECQAACIAKPLCWAIDWFADGLLRKGCYFYRKPCSTPESSGWGARSYYLRGDRRLTTDPPDETSWERLVNPKNMQLITFASPPVGNPSFLLWFEATVGIKRYNAAVRNDGDPVSAVWFAGVYHYLREHFRICVHPRNPIAPTNLLAAHAVHTTIQYIQERDEGCNARPPSWTMYAAKREQQSADHPPHHAALAAIIGGLLLCLGGVGVAVVRRRRRSSGAVDVQEMTAAGDDDEISGEVRASMNDATIAGMEASRYSLADDAHLERSAARPAPPPADHFDV